MDIQAFFKISYGLYIVSSKFEGEQNGCIVNTVSQVTSKPERLSVTISKDNYTTKLIQKSNIFNATVLTQDADMKLIGEFGFKSGENHNKFESFNTQTDINGIKYVTESAAAIFSCKVINSLDLGTHILFVGDVVDATVLNNDTVLTYDYYHKIKKGSTPKNAPSYKEAEAKKGFRCKVCGHVLEADVLPDDYICPVCKHGAEAFEKI